MSLSIFNFFNRLKISRWRLTTPVVALLHAIEHPRHYGRLTGQKSVTRVCWRDELYTSANRVLVAPLFTQAARK